MTTRPPSDRLGELNLHKKEIQDTREQMEALVDQLDQVVHENEALAESTKNRLAALSLQLENAAEEVVVSRTAQQERRTLHQIMKAEHICGQ